MGHNISSFTWFFSQYDPIIFAEFVGIIVSDLATWSRTASFHRIIGTDLHTVQPYGTYASFLVTSGLSSTAVREQSEALDSRSILYHMHVLSSFRLSLFGILLHDLRSKLSIIRVLSARSSNHDVCTKFYYHLMAWLGSFFEYQIDVGVHSEWITGFTVVSHNLHQDGYRLEVRVETCSSI